MASEHIVRFRHVEPSELLAEESILRKDLDTPFLGPGDRPEPYRSQYMAFARLQPVYQQEKVRSPLIVHTPRGQGLLWRWWPSQVGVVLFKNATTGSGLALDDKVTFLKPQEREQVRLDLSRIVLNPPQWS